MRGTGDSTRKILQCLHHALDGDDRIACFVFYTEPALEREWRRTADVAYSLVGEFLTGVDRKSLVTFANRSCIIFRTFKYVSRGQWSGLNVTLLVEDGSMENLGPGRERSSYLEMLHLLKTRIQVYTEE